jgi:rsbT co-antagonist protein RsbR
MSHLADRLAGLRQRQIAAYLSILNGLIWILGTLSLAIGIVAIAAGLDSVFIALAGSIMVFTACAVLARRLVPQNKFVASLLLVGVPMYLIAIGAAFYFPGASFLIAFATAIMMLMTGLVLSPQSIVSVGAAGLLFFVPCVVLAALDVFDANYARVGALGVFVTPIISVAALTFIGLLVFTLNNVVREAIAEAEERGHLAEAARADQAGMLEQVRQQAADQARLLELVRDLEIPVIPLFEGVLALPVVGHLDSQRMTALTSSLLDEVARQRAHTVLVDLTGVAMIDTAIANRLLNMAQGVRLLGAEVMITGIKAEVAQALASLGVSLTQIRTAASLQDGIMQVSEGLRAGRGQAAPASAGKHALA